MPPSRSGWTIGSDSRVARAWQVRQVLANCGVRWSPRKNQSAESESGSDVLRMERRAAASQAAGERSMH